MVKDLLLVGLVRTLNQKIDVQASEARGRLEFFFETFFQEPENISVVGDLVERKLHLIAELLDIFFEISQERA
jgi:hypothetical protein